MWVNQILLKNEVELEGQGTHTGKKHSGNTPTKQKQEERRHDKDTEQPPQPNFLQLFCSEKKGIHQKAKCQPDQGIALVCQVVLFQISQIYSFLMVSRWQQPHS